MAHESYYNLILTWWYFMVTMPNPLNIKQGQSDSKQDILTDLNDIPILPLLLQYPYGCENCICHHLHPYKLEVHEMSWKLKVWKDVYLKDVAVYLMTTVKKWYIFKNIPWLLLKKSSLIKVWLEFVLLN